MACLPRKWIGFTATLLVLTLSPASQALETLLTFRDPEGNPFQQLVVQDLTGSVYVGAVNRLHRLTPGLTLMQSAATGPREDNPDCPPPLLPCSEDKAPSNAVTKGLVIDYNDDTLILCTTLYHGSCQKLLLNNITSVKRLVHQPLVPNKASARCVLFIGPGQEGQQALYVGAEYSSLGSKSYRNLIPSVSSYELSNLKLTFRDQDGGTKKSIKDDLRASFHVQYIHGFTLGDFVYFMTVQKESLKSDKLVTRLARVCTRDKYFRSYVEIPLHCEESLTQYVILQGAVVDEPARRVYAVFTDVSQASWEVGKSSSALCVLDMDMVDAEFNRTVQECYAGQGRVGPPHYETTRTCMQTSADVDVCAGSEVAEAYPSMVGERPVAATAVWTLPGQMTTAVTLQPDNQQNVAYLGTAEGEVIKVVVQGSSGQEVDRLTVDSRGPVLQLQPSTNKDHLYVLSPSKVSLVWARHCEQRQTCDECVAESDPICGWCVMQNRCTAKWNCDTSAVKPSWLPASTATCAKMTNLQPAVVSYESLQSALADKQISFQLEQVSVQPSDGLDLGCLFVAGNSERRTKATINSNIISCPLPERERLPRIPEGKDHEDMVLHFHVEGKSIVTRSVSVYDCRSNSDCGSCTNSSYQCQWCYASGSCIQQSDNCPAVDNRQDPGITSTGACPLVWIAARDKDILVHAGEERQISVQVRNLQGGQNVGVKCHFSYLGTKTTVDGTISSSSLTCDAVKFDYPEKEQLPYVTADFKVSWGPQSLPLDNSQGIQVRIYKCPLLVTNCGKCLSMDAEYECGWCDDRCTLQKHCKAGSWLDRTATCPDPQILRFSPPTGPIKGKTSVSVSGLNLGKTYTDIVGGITVAGINCEVKPAHYEPSSGFVCETEVTDVVKSGTIVVQVNKKYTAEADSPFYFVDPVLTGIMPKKGPRSGGTTVEIKGFNMDAGSDVSVTMDGGNCEVTRRSKEKLECVVPKQSGSADGAVIEVSFGGHKKTSPETFTYVDDPTITMIEPQKSIVSGGTSITVMGVGLDLIQKPTFFVTYGGQFFRAPCSHDNTFSMECIVPSLQSKIAAAGSNITETSPLEVHYGFILDGVMTLKNISHQSTFGPLLLYPDPHLHNFPGDEQTKQYTEKDLLVINGRFRIINNLMASVSVTVGNEVCRSVAATDTAITCEPPASAPDGTDNTGKAKVLVRIGNLEKVVGYLRYYEVSTTDKPMALGVILGVVIPILAIIILLTVCVLRRHRKHKPATDYIPDVLQDYQGKKEDEEMGLNHIAVADVNGQIMDEKDCGPYITELLGHFEDPILRQNITAMMIPRSKLDIGELIGKGHFGVVYKAQLQQGEDKSIQVAAKTLQAKSSESEAIQNFLQEVVLLKNLQHPHLLPVAGVCLTASDDPMIVYPFMAMEDLKNYIGESSKTLTVVELLGLGQQIADGMAYLQEVKVVHRNLAARNCIVMEDGQIRLSDYGMTASLFPPSYYTSDDSPAKDLLKWMAPEVIENFAFTSKSDVWAFGVVLWELLTRGITPYPDVENSSLLPYLKDGRRMKKPRQSPEPVFEMMMVCWSESPDQRPDFAQLNDQLKSFTVTDNGATESSALLNDSVEVGGSTEYLEVIG